MDKKQKDQVQRRLDQARESLNDAKALFAEGAEPSFVMNSLYYTFLFPVLGLLQTRGVSAPLQSEAILLFEREFIHTGLFEKRFLDAIRATFDLRPACGCYGQREASREDIEQLVPMAEEFLENVGRIAV